MSTAGAASDRQRVYAREAPLGTSRKGPYVVRNRASLPLCSFNAERTPYLYSSVTRDGYFTMDTPTQTKQRQQQRQGTAPCPVTAPPRMDRYSRRGFNAFDEEHRMLVRRAWRTYEKVVTAPAQRDALLDELLALSPATWTGELVKLQKARQLRHKRTDQQSRYQAEEDLKTLSSTALSVGAGSSTSGLPSRPHSAISVSPIARDAWSVRQSPTRSTSTGEGDSVSRLVKMSPLWTSVGSHNGGTSSAVDVSQNSRTSASPPRAPHQLKSQKQNQHETEEWGTYACRRDVDACADTIISRPPRPRRATSAMAALPVAPTPVRSEHQTRELKGTRDDSSVVFPTCGTRTVPGGYHYAHRDDPLTLSLYHINQSAASPSSSSASVLYRETLANASFRGIRALCPPRYVPVKRIDHTE